MVWEDSKNPMETMDKETSLLVVGWAIKLSEIVHDPSGFDDTSQALEDLSTSVAKFVDDAFDADDRETILKVLLYTLHLAQNAIYELAGVTMDDEVIPEDVENLFYYPLIMELMKDHGEQEGS